MLVEQYRMNSLIMQWSSSQLYDGRLIAHSSVSNRVLGEIVGEENKDDEDYE